MTTLKHQKGTVLKFIVNRSMYGSPTDKDGFIYPNTFMDFRIGDTIVSLDGYHIMSNTEGTFKFTWVPMTSDVKIASLSEYVVFDY